MRTESASSLEPKTLHSTQYYSPTTPTFYGLLAYRFFSHVIHYFLELASLHVFSAINLQGP